jgi:hypothetical protein
MTVLLDRRWLCSFGTKVHDAPSDPANCRASPWRSPFFIYAADRSTSVQVVSMIDPDGDGWVPGLYLCSFARKREHVGYYSLPCWMMPIEPRAARCHGVVRWLAASASSNHSRRVTSGGANTRPRRISHHLVALQARGDQEYVVE